ncbi:MAG: NADP-dependent oxidoreductase [Anaerolineaceae bacterium]|nr:NADP-dependent oxidoreductase [Anaerolineaceae bacterium]
MMKAARLNAWGQPTQLEDVPRPTPAGDEVLVRVHAASINPLDAAVQAGYLQGYVSVPLTLGTDFAGEVVETGAEVRHVRPGDAVYGLVPMHSGSFAEYVVAKANEVTHKPETLDFVQAAGTPLASLAAYQSLFDLGQAKQGERVLIIGAGGAVGGCAVQLARDLGAVVYAVDLPERGAHVRALGVEHFIDCKAERYEDAAGSVDLVLDFVGGENMQRSLALLPAGGRYVTSLMMPSAPEEAGQRGIKAVGLATQPRVDHLDDLARRIDSGRVKIFINRTFSLDAVNEALAYRMGADQPGKIVLAVL